MTWDLFSSAEAASRGPRSSRAPGSSGFDETRNADLARAIASGDTAFGMRGPGEEWTVSDVTRTAREVVEGTFPPLWVAGEVANFTEARSGHCYFSLRDEGAQLRCVLWRDEARRLPALPENGMDVRALGRLTVYPARGEFQLVVSDVEGRGEGLWKLAFDRLRGTLDAEGLTDPARRRALPAHPTCVGVVTSPSGAALRDVVTVIRRRAPWTRIVLAGCRVQGDGAADEVAAAVRCLGRAGVADVLIVGRGGGSTEDLWAFNEEAVVRAIAESPVPVVSAVGHETDVTLADLVADLRAPTPSAAAEAAVPDGTRVRAEIDDLAARLGVGTHGRLEQARDRLWERGADLREVIADAFRRRRDTVGALAGRLHALSPLAALERGFAVPLDESGRVLRRTEQFVPGERFRLRVADGEVRARVEEDDETA